MHEFTRSSGILLHPTSLPSKYGIGDLGIEAYKFVDFLASAKQKYWQLLPLTPTSGDGCPYNSFSAFAGNPLLISFERLLKDNLLTEEDIPDFAFPEDHVDFKAVIPFKEKCLQKAFTHFLNAKNFSLEADFDKFCEKESDWLDDFSVFMAIKKVNGGIAWYDWQDSLAMKEEKHVWYFKTRHPREIQYEKFLQFIFYRQWNQLKDYANEKEVYIIGDVPIYVSHDSADVWANPQLFDLDETKTPITIAGVPPDYFSETGQLWGNPTYDWNANLKEDFSWWKKRIQQCLKQCDIVRIDHFRAFASYWAVPFGEETAINGEWLDCPGVEFFKSLKKTLGELPIVVEDLGDIGDDVVELREMFDFPGMKILQFAFDSEEENDFLPHTYDKNCVVYTGTHDNDTVLGWFEGATEQDQKFALKYLRASKENLAWDFIQSSWASSAFLAITTVQDLLELPTSGRMNIPGTGEGNWQWRFKKGELREDIANNLKSLNTLYFR